MKLHHDKALFAEIISRASEHPVNGGLGIKPQFIEKDYWITNALYHLSESPYKETGIFKGGTSLAKAYSIGYRFSEYIDIAVMRNDVISDAKLKETIRGIEQVMTTDMTLSGGSTDISVIPGQILLEINSFAKPFPYQQKPIKSFIYDFLTAYSHRDIIQEYELEPFDVNVLDKRTTMTEKIVSLVRFSLAENPIPQLEAKIRHSYDLHYLYEDEECKEYLNGNTFKENFISLYNHDRELFDEPNGWKARDIKDSPLINNLKGVWERLQNRYYKELPPLAYSLSIPLPDEIVTSFKEILHRIEYLSL